MKSKLSKLLLVLTVIGIGYVSYKLHSEDNYSVARDKMENLLSENKFETQDRNKLIRDFESEIKKSENRDRIVNILDGTILIFLTGLYFLTPIQKN